MSYQVPFCEGCPFASSCPSDNTAYVGTLVQAEDNAPVGVAVWWEAVDNPEQRTQTVELLCEPADGIAFSGEEFAIAAVQARLMVQACIDEAPGRKKRGETLASGIGPLRIKRCGAFTVAAHSPVQMRTVLRPPDGIDLKDRVSKIGGLVRESAA
jgi:hypothetical protein